MHTVQRGAPILVSLLSLVWGVAAEEYTGAYVSSNATD